MAKHASTTELRKMTAKDLLAEIREAAVVIAKLRLGVHLQKEKDTAKYQKEKKQLARMKTILKEVLSQSSKDSDSGQASSPDTKS